MGVVGRRVGFWASSRAKLTNIDQYGTKRIPKGNPATKMKPKETQMPKGDQTKHHNDFQKQSVPGHPNRFDAIGPDRRFSGLVLKNDSFWKPFGSQKQLILMENAKQKSIPEKWRENDGLRYKVLLLRLTFYKI